VEVLDVTGKQPMIFFELRLEGFTGFGDQVAIVEVLDGLLDTHCDAQTDNDGGDVDKEVAPGVCSVMRWMNIQHRRRFL
jgi:hypothetical protein